MAGGDIIDFLVGGLTVVGCMSAGSVALLWLAEQTRIAVNQMFGVGGQWPAECRREKQAADDAICAVVDHAEPSA